MSKIMSDIIQIKIISATWLWYILKLQILKKTEKYHFKFE